MKYLNNKSYYIASRFLNLIGSNIYSICVPLFLLDKTNSIGLMSMYYTLIQVPAIILLLFIGNYLKDKNLKKIMLISNLVSVFIYGVLYIELNLTRFSFIFFILVSMLEKINSSTFNVASQSAFSSLFCRGEIDKVNGLKSVIDNASALVAPTIGAFIYSVSGFSCTILVNIVSFICCFSLTLLFKYEYSTFELKSENNHKLRDIKEGISYVKNKNDVFSLFIVFMFLNFLVSPSADVFAPGIIKVTYKMSDYLYGITSTAVSIGVILSGLIYSVKKQENCAMKSFYIQGIIMVLTGVFSKLLLNYPYCFYFLYLLLCFLSGYYSAKVNIPLVSYFQKNVDVHQQTIFFSILTLFSNVMVPLGTSFAGFTCSFFGSDLAYLLNGIIMLIFIYNKRKIIQNI